MSLSLTGLALKGYCRCSGYGVVVLCYGYVLFSMFSATNKYLHLCCLCRRQSRPSDVTLGCLLQLVVFHFICVSYIARISYCKLSFSFVVLELILFPALLLFNDSVVVLLVWLFVLTGPAGCLTS